MFSSFASPRLDGTYAKARWPLYGETPHTQRPSAVQSACGCVATHAVSARSTGPLRPNERGAFFTAPATSPLDSCLRRNDDGNRTASASPFPWPLPHACSSRHPCESRGPVSVHAAPPTSSLDSCLGRNDEGVRLLSAPEAYLSPAGGGGFRRREVGCDFPTRQSPTPTLA